MLDTNCAPRKAAAGSEQRDPRADDGKRVVRLTRGDILISRRLSGMAMTIAVPVSAYHGVALAVEAATEGGASYSLTLAHRDPDLDVVLVETSDSATAAADWKYWSAHLALPRLLRHEGKLQLVDRTKRRGPFKRPRNASVFKRRPRFLARRKPGLQSRKDTVFAGEREIMCYE
ncbi:MAG: DUF6101 family protein [Methylocystis sp.]